MRTHAHRPPRRALPLLLLAALLALGGFVGGLGLAPRPATAVTPGKNGRIAAMRDDGAGYHIVTMTAKGKQVRWVTNGAWDFWPRWSPDGTTILFRRDWDLWAVSAAGGSPTNLTRSAVYEYGAAWSPDGTRIAYVRDDDVWTMLADGSDQRRLLRPGVGAWFFVDWSPDGRHLALDATSGSTVQVWTVDAAGRSLAQRTGGDSASYQPRWSPDGTRIAFARDGDVWTMNADGTDPRNLTNTPNVWESGPAWSPDGKRVLFARQDSGGGCQGLATVPANGGKAKAVPKTAGTCLWAPDWQAKPKKGKGKAKPADAAQPAAVAQPGHAAKAGHGAKPGGHHAKPAGHRRAAR